MKKLFFVLSFILLWSVPVRAENWISANLFNKQKIAPSYPQTDVYVSTRYYVSVTSLTVVVSSYPTILETMSLNRTGSFDSKLEVWDANFSTFTGIPELLWSIDTSSASLWQPSDYKNYMSSGLAVNITGTILPDITVTFRRK